MNKRLPGVIAIMLLIGLISGCGLKSGTGYQAEKKVDNHTLLFSLASKPHVGDNKATVMIMDASGNHINNAAVTIDYGMPAMPGMPAMNYSAQAQPAGNEYKTTINLSMSGSWNVVIKAIIDGKAIKANFSLDVR